MASCFIVLREMTEPADPEFVSDEPLRKTRAAARRRLVAALTSFEAGLLGIGVLISAGAWAILFLGGEAREGETGSFDRAAMLLFRIPGHPHQPIGPPWLQDVMRDLTAFGGTTFVTLATLVAALALIFHRRWRHGLILASTVALAQGCDEWLKGFFDRARPDFAPPWIYFSGHSFPSGHSTASAALWLSLAVLAASFEVRRRMKAFWFAVASLVILAVGLSRVFLGVHWPTDVLAGWVLGACWALVGWIAWRLLALEGTPASELDKTRKTRILHSEELR